jgi:3-hydroxyacyl-CoA dehydrogenase
LSIEYVTIIGHGAVANRIADRCRLGGYQVHQASEGNTYPVANEEPSPTAIEGPGSPHPIQETDLVIYAGYGRDADSQPLALAASMLPLLEEHMSAGAILAIAGADLTLHRCAQIAKRPTQVVGLTFPDPAARPRRPPAVHVSEETAPGVEIAILQFARALTPRDSTDTADAAE